MENSAIRTVLMIMPLFLKRIQNEVSQLKKSYISPPKIQLALSANGNKPTRSEAMNAHLLLCIIQSMIIIRGFV